MASNDRSQGSTELMEVISSITQLRAWRAELRWSGRVALVPTMGNLHEGHLALIRRAAEEADDVVVSIFVNPLQFGPDEDFDAYPRTLDADLELLAGEGVSIVFTPERDTIYGGDEREQTRIHVPGISDILCGAHRPGHFDGVATIVAKLFNLVTPEVAVFGNKDYQQLAVIRRMVDDLGLPVEVIGLDTVRAEDGLALSSRNQYLSDEQRAKAPDLYKTLRWIADHLTDNETDLAALAGSGIARLEDDDFVVEYLEVREAVTLQAAQPQSRDLVVLAAAQLGKARLIDNIEVHR
jgi:pantoate--beta-alanine ligase